MHPKSILVTGGCGFIGSSLALRFKRSRPTARVVCLDNLKRRGSELNISRLREHGIEFFHGDIRNPEDIEAAGSFDLLLECSAEPSVLAGYGASPEYLVNTNLVGTLNCLEQARKRGAMFLFLSTSRVYPVRAVNNLAYVEQDTRYALASAQQVPGVSACGIAETFPLEGARSLYGATKLASELIIQEYADMYGLKVIIDRCGVLTGPWQFGKVDQGVVVLWVARHFWKQDLSFIGFGGEGKQVRDILHVDDLYDLLERQLADPDRHQGQVYNVGGGLDSSVSLAELTELCVEVTGNRIPISRIAETRPADIRLYISDTQRVELATGWRPKWTPRDIVRDICEWIAANETALKGVLQ